MKSIKTEYTNRLICLTFALIFLAGGAGLATVWLRHSIGSAAAETRRMETRLNEVDRALSRINSEIAAGLNPSYLQYQIERFDLGLRRPSEDQIVRLGTPVSLDYFAENGGASDSEPAEGMVYRRDDTRRSR